MQNVNEVSMNHLIVNKNMSLEYNELPVHKGDRKGYKAIIDNSPCVIYRRNSYKTAARFLKKGYPQLKSFTKEDLEYAPSVFNLLEEHGRAVKFDVVFEEQKQYLIAFLEIPPWEGVDDDFYFLFNLIHYHREYQENPDNTFMDDYDLC